jgi:hypothetical protein
MHDTSNTIEQCQQDKRRGGSRPAEQLQAGFAGGRIGPGQKLDPAGADRVVSDEQHDPQAVGEVRITAERDPRRVDPRDPDPFDVAHPLDRLRRQQILDQIPALGIDVRADRVGRQMPGLEREADADVADFVRDAFCV